MVTLDDDGVAHVYERGYAHDVKCGLIIGHAPIDNPTLLATCLTCLGSRSCLTVEDMLRGTNVLAWLVLRDEHGSPCCEPVPVIFTRGVNVADVVFDVIPEGSRLHDRVYQTSDGDVLHVSQFDEPFIVQPGCLLTVPAGKAVLRAR